MKKYYYKKEENVKRSDRSEGKFKNKHSKWRGNNSKYFMNNHSFKLIWRDEHFYQFQFSLSTSRSSNFGMLAGNVVFASKRDLRGKLKWILSKQISFKIGIEGIIQK
jgi:hypothetical protein